MDSYIKPIPEDIYLRAKENNGCITDEDMDKVFTVRECCGYGIYSPVVFEDNGKYYCRYWMGRTCD